MLKKIKFKYCFLVKIKGKSFFSCIPEVIGKITKMKCIDNLDDWTLEAIFKSLPHHSRLICKEICIRWYNILMERIIFEEDRHIVLRNDQSKAEKAPVSVLMQAKKPYDIYSIDSYFINNDLIKMFMHVGATIKEFNYNGWETLKIANILTTMPFLKSLKFSRLKDAGEIFFNITKIEPNFKFIQLEQLHIESVIQWNTAIIEITKVKELVPQNCFISSDLFYADFDSIEKFCAVLNEVKKINNIGFNISKLTDIEKLIEMENLHCDKLTLDSAMAEFPFFLLEELEKKHQNIRNIKLVCRSLPPPLIDLSKVTFLELTPVHPVTSLKPLEHLKNLKKLRLYYQVTECAFGHEPIYLPNLKSFDIKVIHLCHECLQALRNSFKNLIYFKFEGHFTLTWNDFQMLIENWNNLETIEFKTDFIISEEEDFNLLRFSKKDHLRSLKIKNIFIKERKLQKILEKIAESFSNLQELKIKTSLKQNLLEIIQGVVPGLTKLTIFSYKNSYFDSINKAEAEMAHFNMISDYLKRIGLPIGNEEEMKFEHLWWMYNSVVLTFDRKQMSSHIAYN